MTLICVLLGSHRDVELAIMIEVAHSDSDPIVRRSHRGIAPCLKTLRGSGAAEGDSKHEEKPFL
ncbi:MAG TPA: hypothetical protein VFA89_04380 [Terriglobales bacterium]|nr:hypothetical protein [Terriglobales bacterium]